MLERAIRPWPFLVGAAAAFLACCALGRAVSGYNIYRQFTRFHQPINHEALYYPTASQTRAVVRSAMRDDQVAVIVGGNSVMFGANQGIDHLWTKRLQALLGDRYRVFNFALPGVAPADFGAVVAEMAARDYAKVILITNVWSGAKWGAGDVDGHTQNYFFWDAYYKGLIVPEPVRQARLRELRRLRAGDAKYQEMKAAARMDASLYFQDLWTAITYRCFSTVWCPAVGRRFYRPRRCYADDDGGVPHHLRHTPGFLRGVLPLLERAVPERYWGHAGSADVRHSPLAESFALALPDHLRRRTLVVVAHQCPNYVERLPAAVREIYKATFPETVRALDSVGCRPLVVGESFTTLDFHDHCHVSSEGAAKFAAAVAPHVRELAWRLGYDCPSAGPGGCGMPSADGAASPSRTPHRPGGWPGVPSP
jgi:hypothetical protein